MTDGEFEQMAEAVWAIADPVERVREVERLRADNERRRSQIARLCRDVLKALHGHVDDAHPDGWSLTDMGELTNLHRGTIGNLIKGRDLADDDTEATNG